MKDIKINNKLEAKDNANLCIVSQQTDDKKYLSEISFKLLYGQNVTNISYELCKNLSYEEVSHISSLSKEKFNKFWFKLSNKKLPVLPASIAPYTIIVPKKKRKLRLCNNHPTIIKLLLMADFIDHSDNFIPQICAQIDRELFKLQQVIENLPEKVQSTQKKNLKFIKWVKQIIKQTNNDNSYNLSLSALYLFIIAHSIKNLNSLANFSAAIWLNYLLMSGNNELFFILRRLEENNKTLLSNMEVTVIINFFDNFLKQELNFLFKKIWPEYGKPINILQIALNCNKKWQAIFKKEISMQEKRSRCMEIILTDIQNFWNLSKLINEQKSILEKNEESMAIDLIPSRSYLDAFYGFVGGTCLSEDYREVLRKEFINVRIIDKATNRWEGVIHLLYVKYQSKSALVLAGVEPRAIISAHVNLKKLWLAIKQWGEQLAVQFGCHYLLQTCNDTALANNEQLHSIIKQDIASKEKVKLDRSIYFPDKAYNMTNCVVLKAI